MTVTEICLVVIASVLVLKLLVLIIVAIALVRSYRKHVVPLIIKTNGVLDNISAVSQAARDQIDEIRTVMDDITYRTRVMAIDVQERIVPTVADLVSSFSGVARLIAGLFGRGK